MPKISKSAFIRALPPDLSALEVVKRGAKQGLKMSDKYVYNIRAKARAAGGKPKRGPGRPRRQSILDKNLAAYASKLTAVSVGEVAELTLLINDVEAFTLRMRADVLGPALYETLMAHLAIAAPKR